MWQISTQKGPRVFKLLTHKNTLNPHQLYCGKPPGTDHSETFVRNSFWTLLDVMWPQHSQIKHKLRLGKNSSYITMPFESFQYFSASTDEMIRLRYFALPWVHLWRVAVSRFANSCEILSLLSEGCYFSRRITFRT